MYFYFACIHCSLTWSRFIRFSRSLNQENRLPWARLFCFVRFLSPRNNSISVSHEIDCRTQKAFSLACCVRSWTEQINRLRCRIKWKKHRWEKETAAQKETWKRKPSPGVDVVIGQIESSSYSPYARSHFVSDLFIFRNGNNRAIVIIDTLWNGIGWFYYISFHDYVEREKKQNTSTLNDWIFIQFILQNIIFLICFFILNVVEVINKSFNNNWKQFKSKKC